MAFPYKHILVVGATAGIGRAMAERFVETGLKVTVVGRRKERLDEIVQKCDADKARAVVFDISKAEAISEFAERTMKDSPDIDCIFLNAGVQRPIDMTDPKKFDLGVFHNEMNVNFTSFVSLTQAFLPYLQAKQEPTSFIYTTSNLGLVPAFWVPGYSASKAALNAFILCLRDQLSNSKNNNVKVIELSPPAVQSELHDYMGEETGRKVGMPLAEFTDAAYAGLAEGKDTVTVGAIGDEAKFNEVLNKRRELFNGLSNTIRSAQLLAQASKDAE